MSIINPIITKLVRRVESALGTGKELRREVVSTIPVGVFDSSNGVALLEVPVYNLEDNSCSLYARLAAEHLFEKKYTKSHAWNKRHTDVVVRSICEDETLQQLAGEGVLRPGMMVGIFNPRSAYNNDLDMTGQPRKYTHVGLYVGSDVSKQPLVAEQYIDRIRIVTEKKIRSQGFIPREIIDSKN